MWYLTHELKPDVIESLGGEHGIRGTDRRYVNRRGARTMGLRVFCGGTVLVTDYDEHIVP